MRAVKFRAWFRPAKKMIYAENVIIFGGYSECDMELMQFTGRLDRNGKEVYEGDIIKYPKAYNSHTRIIEWREKDNYTGFNIGDGDYVVVGNIYENKELK